MTDNTQRILTRLLVAIVFSIAFAYIESAVVVYLRAIFHPNGFTFPMAAFDITTQNKRLLLTEVGREGATLVLMSTAAWLFGRGRQQRVAWFLVIFAIWDVFYYVWLKVLLDWPATLMDWDILFLIPVIWASPVVCPVLVSAIMFALGVMILYRGSRGRPLIVTSADWIGWSAAAALVTVSFCLGGMHIAEPDYAARFSWPLFVIGCVTGAAASVRALRGRAARRGLRASAASS
jgi:hypothetical protein